MKRRKKTKNHQITKLMQFIGIPWIFNSFAEFCMKQKKIETSLRAEKEKNKYAQS